MKNSFVATLLALAMFVAPTQASVQITEPSVATSATTQLPSFIPDNPVALTEQDMKEVRGEFVWFVAIPLGWAMSATVHTIYGRVTNGYWAPGGAIIEGR